MRAFTVTLGLALAAGSMALAAPALADATPKPVATVMPTTARQAAAIKAKLASVKDPAERRKLEAALQRSYADDAQIKAVPRGAAETGLADVSAGPGAGELTPAALPLALAGLALAGAAGGVVVVRRRRRWLQPA